jgi:hypothetical protein
MNTRQLSDEERRELFAPIFDFVQSRLESASAGDAGLLFALRRKLQKELSYLERGKPTERRGLKLFMRGKQNGLCAVCHANLPEKNAVLDRIEPMEGYVQGNVRLLCEGCDRTIQAEREYK